MDEGKVAVGLDTHIEEADSIVKLNTDWVCLTSNGGEGAMVGRCVVGSWDGQGGEGEGGGEGLHPRIQRGGGSYRKNWIRARVVNRVEFVPVPRGTGELRHYHFLRRWQTQREPMILRNCKCDIICRPFCDLDWDGRRGEGGDCGVEGVGGEDGFRTRGLRWGNAF